MPVGSAMQAVVENFSGLAQILDRLVIKRVAIDMSAHEADHIQGVVLGIVAGTVDRFAQNGLTEVFRYSGFRVIVQDVRAGEAFPCVVDMGERHPLGVTNGTGGRMSRGDDAAIR